MDTLLDTLSQLKTIKGRLLHVNDDWDTAQVRITDIQLKFARGIQISLSGLDARTRECDRQANERRRGTGKDIMNFEKTRYSFLWLTMTQEKVVKRLLSERESEIVPHHLEEQWLCRGVTIVHFAGKRVGVLNRLGRNPGFGFAHTSHSFETCYPVPTRHVTAQFQWRHDVGIKTYWNSASKEDVQSTGDEVYQGRNRDPYALLLTPHINEWSAISVILPSSVLTSCRFPLESSADFDYTCKLRDWPILNGGGLLDGKLIYCLLSGPYLFFSWLSARDETGSIRNGGFGFAVDYRLLPWFHQSGLSGNEGTRHLESHCHACIPVFHGSILRRLLMPVPDGRPSDSLSATATAWYQLACIHNQITGCRIIQ
ncbi:hypothetical protein IW262DRAFT_1528198 [Armillaria fumosa]|nr:hypothetical protein IW262DRAFT_1528198 [Armillaria fumosa]